MFLYVIRNKTNGMEYVGTTTQSLSIRMSGHLSKARLKTRRSPLYQALRDHGVDNFSMELIDAADSYEELMEKERAAIRERGALHPDGYNLVNGGRGNYGWRMTESTRRRISERTTGRIPWNKGKPMAAETREKLSAAKKGKPKTAAQLASVRRLMTPEVRRKISESKRGQKLRPDLLQKWAETQRRVHAEMSMEAKAARSASQSENKRKWWASLTAEQRHNHVQAMSSGHRTL